MLARDIRVLFAEPDGVARVTVTAEPGHAASVSELGFVGFAEVDEGQVFAAVVGHIEQAEAADVIARRDHGSILAVLGRRGTQSFTPPRHSAAAKVEPAVTRAIKKVVGEAEGHHVQALKGAIADAQQKMAESGT